MNAQERTDDQLIEAANRGDAAAFEELYLRHRDWVIGVAQRFTRDREAALDILQDTFIYLLRKFPGFVLTCQLKTFLYPVVRHNALAAARKNRRAAPLGPDQPAGENHTAKDDADLQALRHAVERLDAGHREVLILRFVDDLTLQEISMALQIPLGTVKSRLHNVLRQLREDFNLKNYFQL